MPFLIGVVFITHAVFWFKIQHLLSRHQYLRTIWKTLWAIFGIWLVSFIIFAFTLHSHIKQPNEPLETVDAIIILGGGIQDGVPTPTLASRLDTAVPLIREQPEAIVITSGGVGIGETRSEGEAMAHYLYALHGIPFEDIYQEKKSTSTEENFLFSKKILADKGISLDDPIAIVTSDFHIPRSKAIAEQQGFTHIVTLASPTPLATRYNSWFREYFAYISGWILGEY
ncbi:YdcF family protein [Psychrobacter phenylpyruvicus]|nr:YdcF family protein [Psychrobacter phenylpyruvicus]